MYLPGYSWQSSKYWLRNEITVAVKQTFSFPDDMRISKMYTPAKKSLDKI